MKQQQTPQNYFHIAAKQNQGENLPPWYPDYPELMIIQPCAIVLWAIINGYAFNPPQPELVRRFFDRYNEIAYEETSCSSALILEMAEALNPGATRDVVMAYIRGICDAFYAHQVSPLPVIEAFCELTPRLRDVKGQLDSARRLAQAMGLIEEDNPDDPTAGTCN